MLKAFKDDSEGFLFINLLRGHNEPHREANGPYQEGNNSGQGPKGPNREYNGPYGDGNGTEEPNQHQEQESNGPYQDGNGTDQEPGQHQATECKSQY